MKTHSSIRLQKHSIYTQISICMTAILSIGFLLTAIPVYSQDSKAAVPTMQDILNALRMREAEIQDFRFIVSRSFYHPAYTKEEAKKIAETETNKTLEEASQTLEPLSDDMAQKILFSQLMREDALSDNLINGNLLFFEGLGISTWKYSICSFSTTGAEQEIRSILDQESFTMPSSENMMEMMDREPTHELTLKQVLVNYPDLSVGSYVDESPSLSKNIFNPSNDVTLRIREKLNLKRSIEFPFWHETFLNVTDEASLSMKVEDKDRYRLLAIVKNSKANTKYEYELLCDAQGNSYEIVYRVDGNVQWKGNYLAFMQIDKGNVRVPQVGIFWRPEYRMEYGPLTREATEVHTLLSAKVNRGRSLPELSIRVPKGSKVVDERKNGSNKVKNVESAMEVGPNVLDFVMKD